MSADERVLTANVVSFVNLPTETLPEAVLHFFECDGAAMDVEPQFSEDRVKECVERAVYEIATVDVASTSLRSVPPAERSAA